MNLQMIPMPFTVVLPVADQNEQWFKFLLHFDGGSYKPLEHRMYVKKKVIRRTLEGS